MRRFSPALLGFLVILAAGSGGHAATITLYATINNASENPPTVPTLTTGAPRPASFGTATFVYNNDNPTQPFMTFTATIFNIDVTGSQTADVNDNLGNAHIHAG